jgi:hypothetical protein
MRRERRKKEKKKRRKQRQREMNCVQQILNEHDSVTDITRPSYLTSLEFFLFVSANFAFLFLFMTSHLTVSDSEIAFLVSNYLSSSFPSTAASFRTEAASILSRLPPLPARPLALSTILRDYARLKRVEIEEKEWIRKGVEGFANEEKEGNNEEMMRVKDEYVQEMMCSLSALMKEYQMRKRKEKEIYMRAERGRGLQMIQHPLYESDINSSKPSVEGEKRPNSNSIQVDSNQTNSTSSSKSKRKRKTKSPCNVNTDTNSLPFPFTSSSSSSLAPQSTSKRAAHHSPTPLGCTNSAAVSSSIETTLEAENVFSIDPVGSEFQLGFEPEQFEKLLTSHFPDLIAQYINSQSQVHTQSQTQSNASTNTNDALVASSSSCTVPNYDLGCVDILSMSQAQIDAICSQLIADPTTNQVMEGAYLFDTNVLQELEAGEERKGEVDGEGSVERSKQHLT